ncbi:MAG: hypothetical protein QNJ29_06175 [Rhizobiaceae bacterium]|nr:hypothetical protein [Rhizobiaceae bacterium]
MSDKISTEIVLTNVNNALSRIRTIIFINLSLCALVVANGYLETFSIDKTQLQHAYVRIYQHEKNLKKAESDLEELRKTVGEDADEHFDLLREFSKHKSRVDFAKNSLKDHKLRSVLVPIIGVSIPSNDLNIVCGIFLLFSSIWIVFSINQLNNLIRDDNLYDQIKEYLPALRHSVVFIVPVEQSFLRKLGLGVIAAPAITLTIALFSDFASAANNLKAIIALDIWLLIIWRLVFLSFLCTCLWGIAIYTNSIWRDLGGRMNFADATTSA